MQNAFAKTEAIIDHLLHDISLAFGVPCSFFDRTGRTLGCCGLESRSNFCRFIHFYDTKQICRQSYLQSFKETEGSREPLIYFCPFGLVNVTFPLLYPGKEPFFVTAGPLLYTPADDQLITNVMALNYSLRPRAKEVRQLLGEITVKEESKVTSMTSVIQNALKGMTHQLTMGKQTTKDGYTNAAESLHLWLKANPDQEEDAAFARLKENVLAGGEIGDLCGEELAEVFLTFSAFIFADAPIQTVLHRACRYLEFLMELAKNSGMHPSYFFQTDEINVDVMLAAASKESLGRELSRINYVFIRQYLQCHELRNRDMIFRAMHYIRGHYNNISLSDVAAVVHLNPTYFSNCFKKATGQSYSSYLNKIRIEESKKLLLAGNSLAQIAQQVGFSDQSYFTNVFKKIEGVSPKRWINAREKMEVPF